MERELILDLGVVFNTFLLFSLQLYFDATNQPMTVRVVLAVFLLVPLVITVYKYYLEKERSKREKVLNNALKLRPLLIKLERVRNVWNIGSSLTYHGAQFIDKEIASLGWRRYFDSYGKATSEKFDSFQSDLERFINHTEKQESEEFSKILNSFYWLVSGFRHLHDTLAEMVKLAGKIPTEELRDIQELDENYDNFSNALKLSCDEIEEVGKVFKGRSPLKPLEKISTTV